MSIHFLLHASSYYKSVHNFAAGRNKFELWRSRHGHLVKKLIVGLIGKHGLDFLDVEQSEGDLARLLRVLCRASLPFLAIFLSQVRNRHVLKELKLQLLLCDYFFPDIILNLLFLQEI